MAQKIIQQGAEAIILLDKKNITKRRRRKSYRIPEIDEKIRKQRTRSEAKLLIKASKIIPVPVLRITNEITKEITMDFIDGKKLSDHLDSFPLKKQKEICGKIGENTKKLHDAEIIHGDLTTSNMILVEDRKIDSKNKINDKKNVHKNKGLTVNKKRVVVGGVTNKDNFKVYFIDFGLGFISHKFEDKAVDLHLLRQALESKHFRNWEALFNEVLKEYSKSKDSKIVLERLKAVEKRGRYKEK